MRGGRGENVIFLDIETTGLDPGIHNIWQIAYIKAHQKDGVLKILKKGEILLSPYGRRRNSKLYRLARDIKKADLIVAHNVSFEARFLETYGIDLYGKNLFCTMEESTPKCQIWHHYWGWKWPKLSEAVEILLGKNPDPDKLHDASYDIELTAQVYAHLNGLRIVDMRRGRRTSKARKKLKAVMGILFCPIEPYTSMRITGLPIEVKRKLRAWLVRELRKRAWVYGLKNRAYGLKKARDYVRMKIIKHFTKQRRYKRQTADDLPF